MTKQELIRQVSEKTGLSPRISRTVLESFFEVVKTTLIAGEPIYIRTFGSFTIKQRAVKLARNISQNTALQVAAHVVPVFRPSDMFTDQVRIQEPPVDSQDAAAKALTT